MFDDYVLYLVESLQSHERHDELLASVRGNNNNNYSVVAASSTNSRSRCRSIGLHVISRADALGDQIKRVE